MTQLEFDTLVAQDLRANVAAAISRQQIARNFEIQKEVAKFMQAVAGVSLKLAETNRMALFWAEDMADRSEAYAQEQAETAASEAFVAAYERAYLQGEL
jgi:hypothetical protein